MSAYTTLKSRILLVLVLSIAIQGCRSIKVNIEEGSIIKEKTGEFWAGAYSMDITPPPGQPMGGFGNDIGKIARGHWTRLFANAHYFEDKDGNYMILVATDLWAFPQGLGDYVLEKLQSDYTGFKISRENLLFTATHTHHSPGNYSSSFAYNEGSSRLKGFDQTLFQFLGDRIAFSIIQAIQVKQVALLSYDQRNIFGLTRNRSLDAYKNNPAQLKNIFADRLTQPERFSNPNAPCPTEDPEVFQAIDPVATSIFVRDAYTDKLLSLIVNFSAHPTAMGPDNLLYGGDYFAVAGVRLKQLYGDNDDLIVSFMNGSSGDTSINWGEQNRNETIKAGLQLADTLANISRENEIALKRELYCVLEFNDIRDQVALDEYDEIHCEKSELDIKTAFIPSTGKVVKAGAEDGRVLKEINDQFIQDGVLNECEFDEIDIKDNCIGPQSFKNEYEISKLAAGSAPKVLPVAVFRMGEINILGLPGEVNAMVGYRMKKRINAVDPDAVPIIAGLSNEYASYFTTPSEYARQNYEGGFTIYGEATSLYLIDEVERLRTYGTQTIRYVGNKNYKTHFNLSKKKIKQIQKDNWETIDLNDNYNLDENVQSFEWNISSLEINKKAILDNYIPKVSIEILDDNQFVDFINYGSDGIGQYKYAENDRETYHFISYVTYRNGATKWNTIWFVPDTLDKTQTYRIKFEQNAAPTQYQSIDLSI